VADSVEVICEGTLFATLINEELPTANVGRKASSAETIDESTADFPSAPTKPKRKRSRKKVEEVQFD